MIQVPTNRIKPTKKIPGFMFLTENSAEKEGRIDKEGQNEVNLT